VYPPQMWSSETTSRPFFPPPFIIHVLSAASLPPYGSHQTPLFPNNRAAPPLPSESFLPGHTFPSAILSFPSYSSPLTYPSFSRYPPAPPAWINTPSVFVSRDLSLLAFFIFFRFRPLPPTKKVAPSHQRNRERLPSLLHASLALMNSPRCLGPSIFRGCNHPYQPFSILPSGFDQFPTRFFPIVFFFFFPLLM